MKSSTITLTVAAVVALALAAQAQTFKVIYSFPGHGSAEHPIGGVTIDRLGNLVGTSAWGGTYDCFGNGNDGNFPWDTPTVGPNGAMA